MSRKNSSRDGKFSTSIYDTSVILKDLNLLRGANLMWRKPSVDFLKASKQDNYKLMYDIAINHFDYNLILVDGSIFQFEKYNNDDLRYAFIQAPYNYMPFEDFLLTFMDAQDIPTIQSELDELRCTFENDYEQFLSEQGINSKVIYFRYDVDGERYTPNIHSYAHLHVGHNNDIRIPCASILTPVSFVIFVVKQTYKEAWEKCLADEKIKNKVLWFAQDRELLKEEKWKQIERQELALV